MMTTKRRGLGDSPRVQRMVVMAGAAALLIAGSGLAFAGGAGTPVDDERIVVIRTTRPVQAPAVEAPTAAPIETAAPDDSPAQSAETIESVAAPAVSGASRPASKPKTVEKAPSSEEVSTHRDDTTAEDEDDEREVFGPSVRDDDDASEEDEDHESDEEDRSDDHEEDEEDEEDD